LKGLQHVKRVRKLAGAEGSAADGLKLQILLCRASPAAPPADASAAGLAAAYVDAAPQQNGANAAAAAEAKALAEPQRCVSGRGSGKYEARLQPDIG
jgi:hypothetical protein